MVQGSSNTRDDGASFAGGGTVDGVKFGNTTGIGVAFNALAESGRPPLAPNDPLHHFFDDRMQDDPETTGFTRQRHGQIGARMGRSPVSIPSATTRRPSCLAMPRISKNTERERLDACFRALRRGDTLVVWRPDRLGRSLHDLARIVGDLEAKGVCFESLPA